MSILVIDVGTSSLRASIVAPDGTTTLEHREALLPDTPAPGLVEFDAARMATVALELAARALAEAGPVEAVGIANQRASTIVWDRSTGEPVAPGLGWQDLRTVGDCLVLQAQGLHFAPNQSATKLTHLLSLHDPDRTRDLCFGTVDSWIVWHLTRGGTHATDPTNASTTGLIRLDGTGWDEDVLDALQVPLEMLPAIVDTSGEVATADALDGAPPIASLVGDQQASLVGQGCVRPGLAKITFGTGGMLDLCSGPQRPRFEQRGEGGTFPLVAWRARGELMWGVEAIMLSAGTNVEWLRDDLEVLESVEESDALAAACESSEGVVYVPALLGLGTPKWDFGARGTLLGITRGTNRSHLVRAVLEGVAHRGADLVESAELDTGLQIPTLRIDGGMSRNDTFVQALANATQRPVEISPVVEATTLGAAYLAGLAIGTWGGWSDIAAAWAPVRTQEPGSALDREQWADAVERAAGWFGDLSALSF